MNEEEPTHVLACAFVITHFSETVAASGSTERAGGRRRDRAQGHFDFHSIEALVPALRGNRPGESVGCTGRFVV